MTDRLAELLRQRALMEEHLAWLNREIGEAEKAAGIASGSVPVPIAAPDPAVPTPPLTASVQAAVVSTVVSRVIPPANPPGLASAEVILDKYRVPERALKDDVRKGCFLDFMLAFVLFGLGVVGLYFAISKR
jgi:hypothetical protein